MVIVFGTAEDKDQKVKVADKVDSVITEPVRVQESDDTETAPKSVRRKSNKEG